MAAENVFMPIQIQYGNFVGNLGSDAVSKEGKAYISKWGVILVCKSMKLK